MRLTLAITALIVSFLSSYRVPAYLPDDMDLSPSGRERRSAGLVAFVFSNLVGTAWQAQLAACRRVGILTAVMKPFVVPWMFCPGLTIIARYGALALLTDEHSWLLFNPS
jgi:hypothetical protein